MNWVDLAVLILLALSGMVGFVRGLVREVLGLGAWVGALLVASPLGLFPYVQPYARQAIADPAIADPVAFGIVFFAVLILLWIVASRVSAAVRGSMLGGLDRTLGLVFGVGRGAALVVVAYILAGLALPVETWPASVREARLLPATHRGAAWLAGQLPPGYRPAVAPPPAGREATAGALLHANPVGRATQARTPRE